MQQLQPNTILQSGKYMIERVLGQGGFGNTYVGINTTFDDKVAIKEFFMQGINDRDDATGSITVSLERNKPQFEEQREKFKKEALRIRKLDNPHIVKVHDLFEENGTAYYVMDYVDGENLAERLKRTGKPISEHEVRELLPQILDALKSVHDAGIWHLDLKPANIMVDKTGNIKLIDFGASKQLNAQKGGATTSTAISYTNGYAPREQMEQNYDKFGPWTDIYALGATLYTLLTNKRPPLPTDIDDDPTEDKNRSLPIPSNLSKNMKDLILWMMQTNRIQRPQKVIDLIYFNNHDGIQDLEEVTIISTNTSTTKNRKSKIRNSLIWTSVIILLTIIGTSVFLSIKNRKTDSPRMEVISEAEKTCRIVSVIKYDWKGHSKILPCISEDNIVTYTIPDKIDGYTVTEIGDYAFRNTKIREIKIPHTVKSIGDRAFQYTKLSYIELEKNIEKIGKKAFYMCDNLEYVKIEGSPYIDNEAFSCCLNLMNVVANNNNIILCDKAFYSIGRNAKLHVPFGQKQAFINKGWNEYFSNIVENRGQEDEIDDNIGFDYDKWINAMKN